MVEKTPLTTSSGSGWQPNAGGLLRRYVVWWPPPLARADRHLRLLHLIEGQHLGLLRPSQNLASWAAHRASGFGRMAVSLPGDGRGFGIAAPALFLPVNHWGASGLGYSDGASYLWPSLSFAWYSPRWRRWRRQRMSEEPEPWGDIDFDYIADEAGRPWLSPFAGPSSALVMFDRKIIRSLAPTPQVGFHPGAFGLPLRQAPRRLAHGVEQMVADQTPLGIAAKGPVGWPASPLLLPQVDLARLLLVSGDIAGPLLLPPVDLARLLLVSGDIAGLLATGSHLEPRTTPLAPLPLPLRLFVTLPALASLAQPEALAAEFRPTPGAMAAERSAAWQRVVSDRVVPGRVEQGDAPSPGVSRLRGEPPGGPKPAALPATSFPAARSARGGLAPFVPIPQPAPKGRLPMFLSATEEVGEEASLASNAAISPRTLPLPKRVAAGEAPLLASAARDFGIIDPTLGAYLPLSTRAPLEPLASPTSEFTIMQSWPRLERPLARPGTPMASAPGGSRSDSLPPLAPTPSRASYPRDGSPFVMPDEDGSPTGEAEDTFIPIDGETASAEEPRGAASLLWEKRESVLAGFAPDPPPEPRAAPKARSQDYGTSGQDVFQSLPPAVSESGHYRASLPALALSLAQASMAPPQPVSESGHYRASLPALAFSLAQASMAPPQPARAPIDRPRGGGPLAAESATSGVESRARQPGEPGQALDLDAIAQEVYAILKRRLALERERSWGRA